MLQISLVMGLLVSLQSPFAQAYPTDQITLSKKEAKNWPFPARPVLELCSSRRGTLALVNNTPANVNYRFKPVKPLVSSVPNAVAIEKIKNLPTPKEVFGDIGVPQLASLTSVAGSLYGLVWTTKTAVEPGALYYTEPDDSQFAEALYTAFSARTGIAGNYGAKFGGLYPAAVFDSAVLVNLDGEVPQVVKVYEIKNSIAHDQTQVSRIYDAIYEYAYADLVQMKRPSSSGTCNSLLRGLLHDLSDYAKAAFNM